MMETCNEQLVALLKQKKYHISTAESCTAGMVAASIVDIPGASEVFEEGYVTYSNRVKEKLLGVSKETIEAYTVVSAQVAEQMAQGAHQKSGAEVAVSVTGYAGPDNAEDGTKAGTVYIGTYFQGKAEAKKYLFAGSRKEVRRQAANEAIRFALERITKGE